tara:strand:- start:89 stop:421 length:333 start_codon:yes stop_codon:yes gene_type:complete
MASKLTIQDSKIKDGSKKVGMIKNGCIYDRDNPSSTYLLAMIKNNKIYNRNNPSSTYLIGMVKNGTIYNRDNPSSTYKVGTTRDAEKVISGRCSDAELAAIYILMKEGKL